METPVRLAAAENKQGENMSNVMNKSIKLILMALFLMYLPTLAYSASLPLNKELTVRLSTVAENGAISQVADTSATTDSFGKIEFSFTSVPDSTVADFILLQILDGDIILRHSIVPAADPGEHIDVGISEVSDIQTRATLKAAEISGHLTPLHLLMAQTMFRTAGFSLTDIAQGAAAVVAAATALEEKIATTEDGLIKLPVFLRFVATGLDSAAALYRMSVDNAISSDPNVEAYGRGEAFAALMRSFINSGADAGIPLDTLCTAFSAAGAAAEDSVRGLSPAIFEAVRAGFITGITQSGAYRFIREYRDALTAVGIFPGHFARISVILSFLDQQLTFNQSGAESDSFGNSTLLDQQAMVEAEFNSLATNDLLLIKISIDFFFSWQNDEPEYAQFLEAVASRMSAMGGVMAGMTPATLKAYLDTSTLGSSRQNMLAAWNFLETVPNFRYTPVPGLVEQISGTLTPPSPPDTSHFSGPYRDMLLLAYDMTLLTYIKQSESLTAESALPVNPPSLLPFETVQRIKENDLSRRTLVRQNISGVEPSVARTLVNLMQSIGSVVVFE